nr:MAG TPA: hypothetical protein [Caudoviricetes sp.]
MKMCKDRREDKRIIGEAVLHKMGRGKLFYDNLPFFLIVNKELNCIFSICSKCQTCS